jgi:aminopeptidase N
MKKTALLLITVLNFFTALSQDKTVTYYQDGASNPPDLAVTLKHITAFLSFKPEENLVSGTAEFIFTPNRYKTDSIVFYAPDFTVKAVSWMESSVSSTYIPVITRQLKADYKMTASNLVIYPPSSILHPPSSILEKGKEYTLKIEYEAKPMKGAIYFIGWRPEEEGKRKAIWAHRPHGWIPYMDARIKMDLFITFDGKYKVFSNGERIEVKDNPDQTKTWHYRMAKDHPFFSTSLVIGDYDYQTSKSAGGVPLEYWYYSGQQDKVQPTYQYTGAMMDFFEKELGFKYPYPIYRQAPVIDYMYGAMECTTATVFGDFMLIDPHAYWPRNYINTNAHEMAHQWFGDCVAHLVNKDVWLTESFGTYYAKMFEKSAFGDDQYQNIMRDELDQALNASKTNNYPVGSSMGGVARIYQKGSLVLGMLRNVMGDREYRDAMKLYLERYCFGYAQTSDFVRCTYDVTGKPYNWFFDEWVLHGGEPNYKVTYQVQDDTLGNRSTRFQVWQVQETNDLVGLFKMPILFEVHYKDGTFEKTTAWIENKYSEVVIPNTDKKPVEYTLFDPGRQVIKRVTFDKSFEELSAQALKAENLIDRYDALVALRNSPLDKKRETLVRCYTREKFFLNKTEIIEQLAKDYTPESVELFREALNDKDALVRKSVLLNVRPAPEILMEDYENCLEDFSYLNIEYSLDNLCSSFPEKKDEYLDKTKNMTGWRGLNIRMKWLYFSIDSGKKEYLPELIEYTSPEYEFETRMNSLNALKKLRYVDDVTIKNATSASQHWNNKLSTVGKDYLTYFGY